MKSVAFLGASGEVTGSSFLVTSAKDTKILVDFGMFQGPKEIIDLNYETVGFKAFELDGVVLTHAHLDHCGRLPLLVFGGYRGKIYMTAPTLALVEVILNDSARIAAQSTEYAPLYTPEEVQKTLNMVEVVTYGQSIEIGTVKVTFRDAGHILGSASIELVDTATQKTIVFSGDLGNSPEDIVRPTTYIEQAETVVMESTYGDSDHPQEDPTQILLQEITEIDKNGGVLLIPAFSLERTQELLHRIHHLKKDNKVRGDIPVFMDSPMAIRATVIFKDFKEFYNEELQSHTDDPFSFEGLTITEEARDSKEIVRAMDPKIIIAGSGMLSGGRILHHAIHYLPRPTTRLLFVGYQGEETVGRKILEGAKNVLINDVQVKIKAHISEIKSLSSHADQSKLLDWLGHIKGVKKVILVHGDTNQRQVLSTKISQKLGITDVVLPHNGDLQEF